MDLIFTLFNNHARKGYDLRPFDRISSSVILDAGAVIGAEGVSIAKYKDERVLFRHYGRVVLEENVYVGANAVIQRGRIDDTVIGKGSMISSLCVVGANTVIGKNCTLTIQSGISGSARIGDRCWIGIGAKVRDYVTFVMTCLWAWALLSSRILPNLVSMPGIRAAFCDRMVTSNSKELSCTTIEQSFPVCHIMSRLVM